MTGKTIEFDSNADLNTQAILEIINLKGYKIQEFPEIQLEEALKLPTRGNQTNSIDFVVTGGRKLSGSVDTNCSKNGAMGLLCCSLLNKGTTTLHSIPRIEEVYRIIEVLVSIGVQAIWTGKNILKITPPHKFDLSTINNVSASKTRTILMFIAPLMHVFDQFSLPNSQGCNLGLRTINPHLFGLEKFGINVQVTETEYVVSSPFGRDKNPNPIPEDREIIMWESSDTGAEILLMAAALTGSKTVIKYVSSNYMVREVCYFLEKCGVKIDGIGTQTLTVHGIREINQDIEYYNSEDPIETMMFICAAAVTGSQITINRSPIEYLELELLKLEKMGLKYEMSCHYLSKNEKTKLVDLTVYPSSFTALDDKITCGAYPDINMDNLPFFVPIACLARGESLIHDWVYENRAIYFTELNRLGGNIKLADPHRVYIKGPIVFKPAQVVCPPALRPAMIILLGMLGAPGGVSVLRNVYSIKRGYEQVAERLNTLGADIRIISH